MENKTISIKDLEVNKGQIEGLPRNPRFIRDKRFAQLRKSIEDAPEMLAYRTLLVYPHNGKFVIICGNMRFRACKDIGYKEMPCCVLPTDTPPEKLREYTIKDNIGFGEDDTDLLANEWESEELNEWGVEIAGYGETVQTYEEDEEDEEGEKTEVTDQQEPNEEVVDLLRKTMILATKEYVRNLDICFRNGFLNPAVTPYFAKLSFIMAKYCGRKYPRYLSLAFTPMQYRTSANERSIYEQMKLIANDKTEAGIAGLLQITTKGRKNIFEATKSSSYPFGGARLPLDFPVELAKSLIEKFSNKGKILDPCHGWGGRAVAAMILDVEKYVGVDPSPYAHEGVTNIYKTYSDLSKTNVELIKKPFEDIDLESESFDMALTSPPYFDVEQYDGEETSTRRYNNFGLWCEKFYRVLIEKTYKSLKKGSYFCLQVGNQSYPLEEKAVEYGREIGFSVEVIKDVIENANSKLNKRSEDAENLVLLYKE